MIHIKQPIPPAFPRCESRSVQAASFGATYFLTLLMLQYARKDNSQASQHSPRASQAPKSPHCHLVKLRSLQNLLNGQPLHCELLTNRAIQRLRRNLSSWGRCMRWHIVGLRSMKPAYRPLRSQRASTQFVACTSVQDNKDLRAVNSEQLPLRQCVHFCHLCAARGFKPDAPLD